MDLVDWAWAGVATQVWSFRQPLVPLPGPEQEKVVSLPAGDVLWLRTCLANRRRQAEWVLSENVKKISRIFSMILQRQRLKSSTAHDKQKLSFSLVFLLSPILQKLFLLTWMSLTGFISFRALTFLTRSLSVQVTLLTPSVGFLCPGPSCSSFSPPGVFSWLFLSWDEFIPSLEEVILED